MSFEIPKRCEGCPKLTPYINGLEKVEDTRDQALRSAKKFMSGEETASESKAALEEFLEQHGAILSSAEATSSRDGMQNAADLLGSLLQKADQSSDKVRSSTENVLQACDDTTDAYHGMIEMFTQDCKRGSKTRREYIFFGRKVIKCSSVSFARIVPSRFLP